jgi:hypothetical protein
VTLAQSARTVQEALAARGYAHEVVELPDTTRTAGTPFAVSRLRSAELEELTGGRVVEVAG